MYDLVLYHIHMFMSLLSHGEEGVVMASALKTVLQYLPFAVVTKKQILLARVRETSCRVGRDKTCISYPKHGLFLTLT